MCTSSESRILSQQNHLSAHEDFAKRKADSRILTVVKKLENNEMSNSRGIVNYIVHDLQITVLYYVSTEP